MAGKHKLFRFLMSFVLVLSTLTTGMLPVSTADTAFTDVSDAAYYADAVNWAVEKNITKGTSDTTFSPNDGCTRGQCVTFLYRYAGSPEVDADAASKFTDVKSDAYYSSAVAWAVENGVTTGTSDTTFSPGANCSRAQIVTFLWRYNGKPEAGGSGAFTDVKSDAYYAGAVSWAVEKDITKGTSDTTFSPDQTCTRAQIVTFLYRMDRSAAPEGGGSSVDVYSITQLDLSDDNEQATAVVSAAGDCTLQVRFIEEDVYFSEDYPDNKAYIDDGGIYGSQVAAAGTDMEPVTADIVNPENLPEHFVAEAVLVDDDGDPLCEPFSTIEKTERSQLFEAKTVNDFPDASLVLNFDPEPDNNFGVLADDVKILTADAIDRDEETGKYVIRNPSAAMKAGEKVFISSAENEALFKVASVDESGNTLTVAAALAEDDQYGFALEDFYKYLKVDMDVEIDENGVTRSDDPGEAVLSSEETADLMGTNVWNVYHDVSGEASLKLSPISFETTHFKITGGVSSKVKAGLVIQWDVILFGEDYFRCDLETKTSFNPKVSINGKWGTDNDEELQNKLKNLEEKKELELGKLTIPFGVTGFDAYTDLNLMVKWKLTAGAELTGSVEQTGGFKFNNKDGYQKVDKKKSNWAVNIKGYARITIGPTAKVGVEFLNGALSAGVECFVGGKAEGNAVIPVAQWGDERHACHLCVEGEVRAVVEVDAKLKYKITEKFKGTPIDLNIITVEYKLFDFYVSLINEPDSTFGGQMAAGTGTCPNKEYKVTCSAKNKEGESVDVSVDITDKTTGEIRTTVNTGASVYLPPGEYIASATIDFSPCQKTFIVSDRAVSVRLVSAASQPDPGEDPDNPGGDPENPGGDPNVEGGTVDLGEVNVGDYVTFGHYDQDNDIDNGMEAIEWKVLDKKDGRALLLSKYVLDCKKYNDTYTSVTWETCTLRNWLNSDFLSTAFSSSEKSAIPTVTLSNPDNPNTGMEGGNDTNDRVFLLSLQEMQQYFALSDTWMDYDGGTHDLAGDTEFIGGSKDVITSPTANAAAQGAYPSPDYHDAEGKSSCWWWLRSPGVLSNYAANVSNYGSVCAGGDNVFSNAHAVRPALWVNLAS